MKTIKSGGPLQQHGILTQITQPSARHTPGPWEVGYRNDEHLTPVVTHEARDIATVETYYKDGEANARLIASAPDLLNALELAQATIERAPGSANGTLDVIKTAIAKAKGEV